MGNHMFPIEVSRKMKHLPRSHRKDRDNPKKDNKKAQAAGLLARGYSSVTAAHVLGIRRNLIETWLMKQEFQREVSMQKQESFRIF